MRMENTLQVRSEDVMTVGKVMSALTYIAQILMSVMSLAMITNSITRAKVCIKRIEEVLYSYPVIASGNNDGEGLLKGTIEFKNVSFSYPNSSGRPVISNLNLKINQGEVLAILGATGSGKSSLVNLIPRFYDVTEGEVLVNGINVKEYDLSNLRNAIGHVEQDVFIFYGTIKENILFGKPEATMEEVIEAAFNQAVGELKTKASSGDEEYLFKDNKLTRFIKSPQQENENYEASEEEYIYDDKKFTYIKNKNDIFGVIKTADVIYHIDNAKIKKAILKLIITFI